MSHRNDPRPLKIRDRGEDLHDGWFYHENGGLTVCLELVSDRHVVSVRIPASELREWAREDAARTAKRKARKEAER